MDETKFWRHSQFLPNFSESILFCINFVVFSTSFDCGRINNGVAQDSIMCSHIIRLYDRCLIHGPSRLQHSLYVCNLRRFSCSFISTIIIHRMTWRGGRRWRWTSSSLVWVFGPLWSFASRMRSQRGRSRRRRRRRRSMSSPLLWFVFCFRLISPTLSSLRCMHDSGLLSITRQIDYNTWIRHLTKVWL